MAKIVKNMLKFVMLKSCKTFHLYRNYTVTYLQTLEGFIWFLRLNEPKNQQKFLKNESKFY